MDFRGKNIDLVGKWRLWFGISLAIIVVGMVSWAAFGLNRGIDFKGGGQLQYRIPQAARPQSGQEAGLINAVRGGLDQRNLRGTKIQVAGGDTLVIQTSALTSTELKAQQRTVEEVLARQFKIDTKSSPNALAPIGQQLVGAVIGEELQRDAIKGVLLGVAMIALWIYIRYNFAGDGTRYAVAGILALVHDVLVLVGIFALIGHIDPRVEVDSSFIAALLTVVGYSINDSVVIFDRLRENLRLRRKEPFNKVVNDSLLETMSRSINTGLTVVIMLLALVLLGGESIYNFALAMLIGIVSGLYSSIFNASMVLVVWHMWDEKKKLAGRAGRPAARAGAGAGAARPAAATRAATTAGASNGAARPVARGGLAAAGLSSGGSAVVPPLNPNPSAPPAAASGDGSVTSVTTISFVDGAPQVSQESQVAVAEGEVAGEPVDLSKAAPLPGLEEAPGESDDMAGRVLRPSQKARAKRRF